MVCLHSLVGKDSVGIQKKEQRIIHTSNVCWYTYVVWRSVSKAVPYCEQAMSGAAHKRRLTRRSATCSSGVTARFYHTVAKGNGTHRLLWLEHETMETLSIPYRLLFYLLVYIFFVFDKKAFFHTTIS